MKNIIKIISYILMMVSLIRPSAIAGQNEYEIELKDLNAFKTRIKQQQKPQIAPPMSVEIDLKDLRNIAPPKSAKSPQQKRQNRNNTPEIAKDSESKGESIYVVRPGEHLFKILIKRYGESNKSAEKMIPNVMRINGITSPRGLKVGQRLRIPLPAEKSKNNASLPTSTLPLHGIITSASQTAVQATGEKPAAPPTMVKSISIVSAPPCKLAHDISEKMGLLGSYQTGIKGFETVNVVYAGRSVIVACGLSNAEKYVYERLLAHSGNQLLTFESDVSSGRLVERLGDSLGLVFHKRDNDSENLPLAYTFEPFGAWSGGLQLTILHDLTLPAVTRATDNPEKQPDYPKLQRKR